MQDVIHLLNKRRFLPLFVTQALGAFNDNLFKSATVYLVVYEVLRDPKQEEIFSGVATALSIIPFLLLSAVAGQLSDATDKAKVIRWIKTAEIGIMLVGAAGLLTTNIFMMLSAVFALGIHSAFFGPTKYALLPQHLQADEVLGGTGLVEAGTYLAILIGTITAGFIGAHTAAAVVMIVALIGWISAQFIPPAPPIGTPERIDWNIFRASWTLIAGTMKERSVFLALVAISFFWTIGAIIFIQFPPLVKNVLNAEKNVASLFLAIFSVGIAIGSVAINSMLRGRVSARYSPASVIAMGGFVVAFYFVAKNWSDTGGQMHNLLAFAAHPGAIGLIVTLLGIAIAGGMFVVPLYAFLTTKVPSNETARTVGANNVANAFCMVTGSGLALGLTHVGVAAVDQFLLAAAMCGISAWLATLLHRAELAENAR